MQILPIVFALVNYVENWNESVTLIPYWSLNAHVQAYFVPLTNKTDKTTQNDNSIIVIINYFFIKLKD